MQAVAEARRDARRGDLLPDHRDHVGKDVMNEADEEHLSSFAFGGRRMPERKESLMRNATSTDREHRMVAAVRGI